jgi:hypothetical protein
MKQCPMCDKYFHSLHSHHIVWRAQIVSNGPENRIKVCYICHGKLHNEAHRFKLKESMLNPKQLEYVRYKKPDYKHIAWGE